MSVHGERLRRTPLAGVHRSLGARMIPFAGWEMPVEYTGILEEHRAVRTRAGLFDVSHMGQILVEGPGSLPLLQRALTNDLSAAAPGRAVYSPMCRADGGVIDDLIAARLGPERFLLVVNAANRKKDFLWLAGLAQEVAGATLADLSDERALLALQGPEAEAVLAAIADGPGAAAALAALRPFRCLETFNAAGVRCLVSRTGYTGEDGFELSCRADEAGRLWGALMEAGAPRGLVPAGLGARDTLRLEAALPLYGHELSEDINPLEVRLDRFVRLDKPGGFVGSDALARVAAAGPRRLLVGLEPRERGGIPRSGHPVRQGGRAVGEVTSGSFAPTLGRAVALALVEAPLAAPGTVLAIEIRGRELLAEVVPIPFYRRGRAGGGGA